jgi:hypothetical protein
LIEGLKHNKTITKLNLEGKMKEFFVSSNPSLTLGNWIDDDGGISIASLLECNDTLTSLNLRRKLQY